MSKPIEVFVQCPPDKWDSSQKMAWLHFRELLERIGVEWEEGMGQHKLLLKPDTNVTKRLMCIDGISLCEPSGDPRKCGACGG